MADSPPPIRFDPPYPVYLLDIGGGVMVEPLRHREDVQDGRGLAIPNPWKNGQFLAGIARGNGSQFVLEVGASFGALAFDEERGWVCRGLVLKQDALAGVAQELIDKEIASSKSFTENLVKKTAKKPVREK